MKMHKQIVHIQSSSDSLFDCEIEDEEVQAISVADENRRTFLFRDFVGACITGSFILRGALFCVEHKLASQIKDAV